MSLREQHKQTTRRALEDAALRLFARDGFDATSVEAIAAEAHVSPRTFFRYFATKDDVLTPDREARQARLREEVRRLGGSGKAPFDLAAEALLAIAPDFEAERTTMVLRRQAAASSPALRGRLYDVIWTWQATLAEALAACPSGADPDARAYDATQVDVAAAAAIAVWQTAITRWLADRAEEPLTHHLERAFAALRP